MMAADKGNSALLTAIISLSMEFELSHFIITLLSPDNFIIFISFIRADTDFRRILDSFSITVIAHFAHRAGRLFHSGLSLYAWYSPSYASAPLSASPFMPLLDASTFDEVIPRRLNIYSLGASPSNEPRDFGSRFRYIEYRYEQLPLHDFMLMAYCSISAGFTAGHASSSRHLFYFWAYHASSFSLHVLPSLR